MRDAREALGITATLAVLGLVGLAVNDGLALWFTDAGLLALAVTFSLVYVFVLAWVVWHNGRR